MEQNQSTYDPMTSASPATAAAPKADLGKRIVALIIDAIIGAVISLIPMIGWLVSTAYWLLRDGLDIDFMRGRSIGKKVMKLRPVRLDGGPMNIETSVRRNWPLAVGGIAGFFAAIPLLGWLIGLMIGLVALGVFVVEVVLVLTDPEGRRLGDRTGATKVVESAD